MNSVFIRFASHVPQHSLKSASTTLLTLTTTLMVLGTAFFASSAWTQEVPVAATVVHPRIERLHHEDAGSKVDELRVGGVTQRIEVQSKIGAGSNYHVEPATAPIGAASPASERSGGSGRAGRSSWRVFQF